MAANEVQRSKGHVQPEPARTEPVPIPGSGFDLLALLPSWERGLRARRRAPRTIGDYLKAATDLAAWLPQQGMPTDPASITREHIEAYIVHELGRTSPTTTASAYRRLQQLFKWLTEEGEIPANPMARMSPPTLTDKPVPVLKADALKALLAACSGSEFIDRRDTAIIRLFIDSGVRRSELAGIRLEDIDWEEDKVRVRGKGPGGEKPRDVPFGLKTSQALDRYVRVRNRHQYRESPWFWLGTRGWSIDRMTGSGIAKMLTRRAEQAGVEKLHPHMFRHTMSHRWLAAGGQEGDLMRINGWSSRDMLDRYARSAADERAREAHRNLALGDDL